MLRVRGIPVRLHWTLAAMVLYLIWAFAARFAPLGAQSGRTALPPLVWGLILAVGLILGVLVHELAHSLLAIRLGGRVRSITLTFLGGMSEIAEMPPRSGTAAGVAAAGPLASLLLGVLSLLGGALFAGSTEVHVALVLFGRLNLVIALFNLLPALPLDGGRVLRALLEARFGRLRATTTATIVSKALAVILGVLGLLGNWMFAALAVLLWVSADAELRAASLREALTGLFVVELMEPLPGGAKIEAGATLAEAAARMVRAGSESLLVIDPGGNISGVVQESELRGGRPELRATSPLRTVLRPLPRIDADRPATDALAALEEAGATAALVTSGGRPLGLVRRDRMLHAIELRQLASARARKLGRRTQPPRGLSPQPR